MYKLNFTLKQHTPLINFLNDDSSTLRASEFKPKFDKYLIKVATTEVTFNGKDGVNVFLYILAPPKIKLSYQICDFNNNDSVIHSFSVPQSSFFYQGFFEKRGDSLKLGVLLNKYDSLSKKEEVIIKYLKTSYP